MKTIFVNQRLEILLCDLFEIFSSMTSIFKVDELVVQRKLNYLWEKQVSGLLIICYRKPGLFLLEMEN